MRRRQRAEPVRPSFAIDRIEPRDHRRDFLEDRVEKRIAIFLGAAEQFFFHFIHRPRPERIVRIRHSHHLQTVCIVQRPRA